MARRKKPEEPANHERWLVSYADFITLLFAFFVVMYSISSVNEGKYRVLSDSISSAFNPSRAGLPIKLNSPMQSPIVQSTLTNRDQDDASGQYASFDRGPQASKEDIITLRKIASRVEKGLSPLIDKKLVKIRKNDLWIEIEIKSSILYASGSAKLSSKARPVLRQVSKILSDFDNQIQVEGFTDNIPIDNEIYPSNWELSAARAASVVHLFSREGVSPKRLSAVGYGEFKPITSNDTAKGRRKNRRVNIVVLSDAIARRTNRAEQLEKSVATRRKIQQQKNKKSDSSFFNQSSPPIYLLPPSKQTSLTGVRQP